MQVTIEKRHLKFQSKGNTVYIDFDYEFYPSPREYRDRRVTYCTISVYGENGMVDHYHGATVFNPNDTYNQRTGMFIAFRKALRQRWYDIMDDDGSPTFAEYHKAWSHFLAGLMDGKVDDGQDNSNPL